MNSPQTYMDKSESGDVAQVRSIYQQLLQAWNDKDARKMADLFAENGNVVGFDGSQMDGPRQIESVLGQIFADHPSDSYLRRDRSGCAFARPRRRAASRGRRDGAVRKVGHQPGSQCDPVADRD